MPPNPMHDLPVDVHHRREAPPKAKEMKPLLTREPLSHDREKKPPAQPMKKRKRVQPTTPALTFDPKRNHVPSGRQDPPVSPSAHSRPSTSESSTSSYEEPQAAPLPDRGTHDQFYNGYDTQKRPRMFPECPSTERSASYYPDHPRTDGNEIDSVPPPNFIDSPASYTSPSSPAPSEQSPCAEFAFQVIPPLYAFGSQGYVHQPVAHQDYGYPTGSYPDRPAGGYPMQYSDPAYGRPPPHGIPAYPDNNGYLYPPGRRY